MLKNYWEYYRKAMESLDSDKLATIATLEADIQRSHGKEKAACVALYYIVGSATVFAEYVAKTFISVFFICLTPVWLLHKLIKKVLK